MIELKDISKSYAQKSTTGSVSFWSVTKNLIFGQAFDDSAMETVLENVTLTVQSGTCIGVLGKNGSGKSTLLKIIAGIEMPTSGKLGVKGTVNAVINLSEGIRSELSGYENIENALLKKLGAVPMNLAREIADFSELEDALRKKVGSYSSGMKARIAFSIMSHIPCDILILDEVLAVGDFSFNAKCRQKINDLKKKNITIVYVSHSSNSIIQFCDRALVLERGEIKFDGLPTSAVKFYEEARMSEKESIGQDFKKNSFGGETTNPVKIDNVSFEFLKIDTFDITTVQITFDLKATISRFHFSINIYSIETESIVMADVIRDCPCGSIWEYRKFFHLT